MTIFTIIVTYNGMQHNWIERCLRSLEKSTIQQTAIVVDNMSVDGTRDYVPTHFPKAIWLPQDKNLGFGQANNIGIDYALKHHADFILLLNQDAALAPDALQHMVYASDGESLLSPLHLNGNGSKLDSMFKSTLLTSNNELLDDLLIGKELKPAYQTGEICAACWFMPRKIIEKIGGFNPLFFHYGEDNNYYQRLVYHHIKVFVIPHAIMYHDRKTYGNIEVFNKLKIRRDLLLVITNINFSLPTCLLKFFRIAVRCYVYDLPRSKYRIGSFTWQTLWILCNITSVISSRKNEKQLKKHWI